MKLIYIAQNLSDPIGGAEISSINLVEELTKSGIVVDCIDHKNMEKFSTKLQIMGPEKALKDYDLVMTQLGWAGEAEKIAKAAGKKLLYFFHSWEHICKVGHTGIIPAICNMICKHCYYKNSDFKPDYAIANSKYTQKMLKEHFDIDSTVIYPLLDYDNVIAEECNPIYITMSRYHYMKGTDRFVKIAKAMPDHKFRIVGYGREHWEDELPSNIVCVGHMNPKDYYKDTSIWLSPSRFDSFGMTIMEAQLNNIPVVATNICAVKEDETVMLGSIIDDGDDIDAWIEKILFWNKKINKMKPNKNALDKFLSKDKALKLIDLIGEIHG
jgi:glycosyltransferase involved in cell wall biosynthesis